MIKRFAIFSIFTIIIFCSHIDVYALNDIFYQNDNYEEDGVLNDDDKVKQYNGKFEGKTLVDVELVQTFLEGNIESSSDKKGEFYIKMELGYLSGDSDYSSFGPLFKADIRVD